MGEAKFYKKINNNTLQCQLCNHFCVVEDGKIGNCRVRKNEKGKLYSLVYGYPVAINTDPIEKKPLFHFLPGSLAYSLGTLGCNFACANCQNWDISQAKEIEKAVKKLDFVDPQQIINNALAEDCRAIAYTYNEPTIFTEYALDIMKLARSDDLRNVWISNGFMSNECLDAILPYLDAANVDLKSIDAEFYQRNCSARLQPILDNLKRMKNEQIHVEIATLIIPTLSNDLGMLKRMADFIANELDVETPWHLSKFSPAISWKQKNLPETDTELIYEAYVIGKEAGLKYVYVGNIPGDPKENTYCPHCNELVIRRTGYVIERLDNDGNCPFCDTNLDIIS